MMKFLKSFSVLIFVPFLIGCNSGSNSAQDTFVKNLENPVFVFGNAFYNEEYPYSFEERAKLLKELKFDGIEYKEVEGILELKEIFDNQGLRIFTDYMKIDIDSDQPYLPEWKNAIPKLKGSDIILWVHIHSQRFKPSDEKGDSLVVSALRELADYAMPYGVRIAIYHHTDFLAETAEDAYRLALKTDRENVGVVFNLCHFLKKDDSKNLKNVIDEIYPKLFAVSISGANKGDTQNMGWDQLIQPLGQGTFDVYEVVSYLADKGYKGPIGLQCYEIKAPPSKFLKQSSEAWISYKNRYKED